MVAMLVWMINIATIFIYILTMRAIDEWVSKVVYASDCLLTLVYIANALYNRNTTPLQINFIVLSLASLSIYYLFLILYYLWDIDDYKYKLGVFLLIELITTCFVFISGLKKGLFNDAKDML